jgi:hypothetical protein
LEAKPADGTTSTPSYAKNRPFLEPFLGPEIDLDVAAKIMTHATLDILKKYYEKDLEVFDINSLNLLLFLFQRSAKEDKWKDRATELGEIFASKMKDKYHSIKANGAINGIALIKPDSLDELLFYGKHQSTEEFCFFLTITLASYISVFMGVEFKPDRPLCAASSSSSCIYTFLK